MKSTWRNLPLSEVVSMRPGNNKIIKGKQSDRPGPGLFQAFSASGPDVWVSSAEYNQPGVVISAVGARCGKTFIAQGRWSAIANTHVLLPSEDVDPRWLWYRTNNEDFWIRGGTAQPFVKVRETLQRPCMIPPLAEQQRIVRLLDEAFEGIAIAKANTEKNLQNTRTIFESHLRAAFQRRGDGWQEKALEEVCQFSNGLWKGETPPFERVGVIRNTNFTKDGKLDESDIAFLDVEVKKLEKRRLKSGDIILEKSGGGPKQAVGRVVLFEKETGSFSFSNFTAAMRVLDHEIVYPRFLHKFLFWTYISGATENMQSNSTGIRNLNGDAYKAIRFSFPSLPEQIRLAGLIDELQERTNRLAQINLAKGASLRALQESLLREALTGQLRAA